MQYKPRRSQKVAPARFNFKQFRGFVIVGAVFVVAALLLFRLFDRTPAEKTARQPGSVSTQEPQADRQSEPSSGFDAAFQAVLGLEQQATEYAGVSRDQTRYGITQQAYDQWRQSRGQAPQNLSRLSDAEVQAIYQQAWREGNCGSYAAPLDVACLDTLISFGADGKTFFANVPSNPRLIRDPEQTAIDVANSRMKYRRRSQQEVLFSYQQAASEASLNQGLLRDRALVRYIMSLQFNPPARSAARPVPTPPAASSDFYNKVKPFTVEVWIKVGNGREPATGMIVDGNGIILTNYHVIENDPTMRVKLSDGREFTGKVIKTDRSVDLALIKIDGASGLPTTPFAESSTNVKVGDTVYALGSPEGYHWKLTASQVIRLSSICTSEPSKLRCIRTKRGLLLPGNSGGPLLNPAGQVIGINRAIQEGTGEGVSIPVEVIKSFLAQMGMQPPVASTQ